MKRALLFFLASFFLMKNVKGQILIESELKKQPVYTSIEEALKEPEKVYRFKLKTKADSLPEEIFQFTNLQELNVSKCRLSIINDRIKELKSLQFLDVSVNQLVRLPESICLLVNLKELIINRNHIEELPTNIGNMQSLTYIDAWDNPLYSLPASISDLQFVLREIDLRQIELRDEELEAMEKQLPNTRIQYTSTCDCHSRRGK